MARKDKSVPERVRLVIAEQLGVNHEIKDGDRIIYDLDADSLDTIELVMALEEEFEIEISDAEGEDMMSRGGNVGQVVALIESKVRKNG